MRKSSACDRTYVVLRFNRINVPRVYLYSKVSNKRTVFNNRTGVTLFYKKFKLSTGLGLFSFLRPQGFQKVQIQPHINIFSGVGTAYSPLIRSFREDFFRKLISVHCTFIRDLRVFSGVGTAYRSLIGAYRASGRIFSGN